MRFITSVHVLCAMLVSVIAAPIVDIEARERHGPGGGQGGRGGPGGGNNPGMVGTTFLAEPVEGAVGAVGGALKPVFNAKDLRDLSKFKPAEEALIKKPSLPEPEFKVVDLRELTTDPDTLPTPDARVLEAQPQDPSSCVIA
jgi:hypothetical protein